MGSAGRVPPQSSPLPLDLCTAVQPQNAGTPSTHPPSHPCNAHYSSSV